MEILNDEKSKTESNELSTAEPDSIEPNLKTENCEESKKDVDISSMGDGNISDNTNLPSDTDEYENEEFHKFNEFEKNIWKTLKRQQKFLEWKNKTTHCHMDFLDVGFKNIQEELNDIAERNDAIEQVFRQRNQLFEVYKRFLEEELCKTESQQVTSNKRIESGIHSLERRVESWQCLLEKNVKELF